MRRRRDEEEAERAKYKLEISKWIQHAQLVDLRNEANRLKEEGSSQ